jgi:hypothetical protein
MISDYFAVWVARKVPTTVRVSLARDYNHFRSYILPFLQNFSPVELSIEHLEELKARSLSIGASV